MPEPRHPRRRGKPGASLGSPAALGVVRVGDDFGDEFPDGDAVAAEVFATLVRAGNSLLGEINRATLATFGVAQGLLNGLAVIEGAERPLTPSEISERTFMLSGTTTGLLDALERNGWIRRVPNPDDRRSVFIEITDEGRAVIDHFLPGIRALENRALAELTAAELVTLRELLAKVLRGTAAVAAEAPVTLDGRRNRPQRPN